MKTLKYFMGALLVGAVVFAGCKKDDDKNNNNSDSGGITPEESVPEFNDPAEGYVRFVIQIPTGTECNGIAIKGTYDGTGWSGADEYLGADQNAKAAPDSCIKFEAVPDFEGWYSAEYKVGEGWDGKDAKDNDVKNYMAGKICLIYSGDGSWEGQASSWDYSLGNTSVAVSKSNDGNIQINSNTGFVYVKVEEWQKSECAEPEDYVITVESSIDFWIVGDMNEWTPTKMENNTLSGSFAPGTKFKFASHDGTNSDWWEPEVAVDVNYNAETNCYSTGDIVLKSGENKVNIKIVGIIGEGGIDKCE